RLSVRAISDLERGVKQWPRRDTVELLADALELSAQERATFARAANRRVVPPRRQAHARASAPRTPQPHLGALSAPFGGRTRERGLLEGHLAGEGAPLLLLSGEPGIGKTRLLREVAQHAVGHGWRVLEGGCERRGGQEPYAPLPG